MGDTATKYKKVPELRFSGFNEEWGEKELGEISEKVKEKNKDNLYSETFTNSAEHGILSQKDFFDKDISNEQHLKNYYIVRNDDFIYNPRISKFAPVGPIRRNKLNRTGVMSPIYYVFRTFDVDKRYLENYFLTVKWHKFMIENGNSGARSDRFSINDTVFKKMSVPYPSIEEQQKIGDFFNKLDRRIELEEKKLDLLEEQKKGYMQKIFSRELQFKDENGNSYPEWEEKNLGDIFDYKQGKQVPVEEQYYELQENFSRFIRIVDLTDKNEPERYVMDTETGKVNYDDIFMVRYGRPGIVGYGYKGIIANNMFKFIPKTYVVNSYYQYLLKHLHPKISALSNSSTMPALNFNSLSLLKIVSPEIDEQHKIGSFLQKLDQRIESQSRKIESLKTQKKGFLQKMFV